MKINADAEDVGINVRFWRDTFGRRGLASLKTYLVSACTWEPRPRDDNESNLPFAEEEPTLRSLLRDYVEQRSSPRSPWRGWRTNSSRASFSRRYDHLCDDERLFTVQDSLRAAGIPVALRGRPRDMLNEYIVALVYEDRESSVRPRHEYDEIIFRAVKEGRALATVEKYFDQGLCLFIDTEAATRYVLILVVVFLSIQLMPYRLCRVRGIDPELFVKIASIIARSFADTVRVGTSLELALTDAFRRGRSPDMQLADIVWKSPGRSTLMEVVLSDEFDEALHSQVFSGIASDALPGGFV